MITIIVLLLIALLTLIFFLRRQSTSGNITFSVGTLVGNSKKVGEIRKMNQPVKTSYESKEVDIPDTYLKTIPEDAQPIIYQKINFLKATPVPEYDGCYAVVLDNVLSASECAQLISLAESSVLDAERDSKSGSSWRPALVNVGQGYEVLVADYRNSDRIIWDNQEIVDRLWSRLVAVPEIAHDLSGFNEADLGGYTGRVKNGTRMKGADWDFWRVNKRLRFLKYGAGQFFRPHCDGPYGEQGPDGEVLRTHFTVHLYLNDSKKEVPGATLAGGATSFLSGDETRKFDVDPRAGRVLIFQHKKLYHSGDDVTAGIKYTVRTDIMYKLRKD
jgi:hypothetical protein